MLHVFYRGRKKSWNWLMVLEAGESLKKMLMLGWLCASVVQNLITWSPWPKFPDIFSPLFPPRLSPTWHVASDLERKVHNPRRPRAAPPLPCIWERLWLPWNDHWFGLKFTTPKGVVLVKLWTSWRLLPGVTRLGLKTGTLMWCDGAYGGRN